MKKYAVLLAFLSSLCAALAQAAGPDPRERNFKFFVDGVETDGIVGYRIAFARQPVSRTDSRRLDLAYSPDQRQLIITVTQKGLNRLQDWLNGATDTAAPATKTVSIEARDNQDNLLARWELTGVTPSTITVTSSVSALPIHRVIVLISEALLDRRR